MSFVYDEKGIVVGVCEWDLAKEWTKLLGDVLRLKPEQRRKLFVEIIEPSMQKMERHHQHFLTAYRRLSEPPLVCRRPRVRTLGHGKDEERNTLARGTARQSGADGFGSREGIREQIGGDIVDLSEGWMQPGHSTHPLTGRALRSNVPRGWIKQHETDTAMR